MYPRADIPVFEMSLNVNATEEYHYALGWKLSFLRERGVLVIGSGNIVHNLAVMKYEMEADPYDWAREFDLYVRDCLLKKDHDGLIHYESAGPSARLSVPTTDHYLPLLYIAAMQDKEETVNFTYEGIQHGSVSMRCLKIG